MTIFVYEYVTAQGEHHESASWCSPSLLAEGRAMRDAIVHDLRAIPRVEVVTLTGADTQQSFQSRAARCDYSMIIAPEFDGILETRCCWVIEAGGRLLGPSPEAISLTADKLALFHHFQKHDIPTPTTWRPVDAPSEFPQVWKPRFGAGSQATFRIGGSEEMDAALKTIEQEGQNPGELIVQQFVEGTPASVAFLVGPDTMLSLQPCHQWLSTDGRFRYEGGMCPMGHADYAPRAVRLAGSALRAIPGLFGYVGVDVVLGNLEPRDYVIEVNPRLTTSYVGLRALADFNIAEAMLNIARGENLPPLGWKKQFVDFMPNGTVSFVSDTLV